MSSAHSHLFPLLTVVRPATALPPGGPDEPFAAPSPLRPSSSLSFLFPALLFLTLLAAPDAHAGTYTVTYSGSGKSVSVGVNAPGGINTVPYTGTYGGGGSTSWSAPGNKVTCDGSITATATWQASGPGDNPPATVIVQESGTAMWSGTGVVVPTGKCDDGLGDAEVDTTTSPPHPGPPTSVSGISTGVHYTVKSNPGMSFMLTPTANANVSCTAVTPGGGNASVNYTLSISPVTISLGGAIKDSSGNYNILVGQGCGASLSGTNGLKVSNYKWSVSGTTFQDWEPTTQGNQSATPPIPANPQASFYDPGPGDQTQPTYHWFWNDSTQTQETVTCTATVTPPAGQGAAFQVTATQKVTVYLPTWAAANATGYGYVGYPTSSQSLELYAGPSAAMQQQNQKDGSVWDTNVSSPVPAFMGAGQWGYAQIINPGEYFKASDGSMVGSTDTGIPALDNTFPYEGTHMLDGGNQRDGDAPALPLADAFAEVFMTDVFRTYLMFRPSGSDTRWVPLAETGWDTEFDAKEPGTGHWSDYPANTSVGPVLPIFNFKPQNAYPSWTKVLPKGTPLFH